MSDAELINELLHPTAEHELCKRAAYRLASMQKHIEELEARLPPKGENK